MKWLPFLRRRARVDGPPVVTRRIRRQAAGWITRLHGPDRSPQMDRECREWQARSEAHRLAFERSTQYWQEAPRLKVSVEYAKEAAQRAASERESRVRRAQWAMPLAVALGLSGMAVVVHLVRNLGVYSTDPGEQRVVMLDDGSRMSLNTDSRVRVNMGSQRRSVDIQHGEALFEVAKDVHRSFVVQAAGSEVVAHGTVFAVRLVADRPAGEELDVTLIEGKVTVQASPDNGGGAALAPAEPFAMQPGERIRLARDSGGSGARVTQRVDRPRSEAVAAWRRNEVVFDNTALADAVAEMNRYDRTPVVVVGEGAAANLRVSGSFRTGDTASFARTVATVHGLVVLERGGHLEITNPP